MLEIFLEIMFCDTVKICRQFFLMHSVDSNPLPIRSFQALRLEKGKRLGSRMPNKQCLPMNTLGHGGSYHGGVASSFLRTG